MLLEDFSNIDNLEVIKIILKKIIIINMINQKIIMNKV